VVFQSRPGVGSPDLVGTSYAYDSLDRPLRTALPDLNVVQQSHTFWESHTLDPKLHHSYVVRDVDGRTVKSVQVADDATLISMTYTYGDFNQIKRIEDSVGNSTLMDYDQRGRRTQLSDPDTGTSTNVYNGFGELTETWAPAKIPGGALSHTTIKHDVLGRVYETDNADGATTFTWDTSAYGLGKLARTQAPLADGGATQTLAYDAYGRPRRTRWTIGTETFDVDLTYDNLGRPSTVAYPSVPGRARFTVEQTYASTGYPQSMSEIDGAAQAIWQVLARNADDKLLLGALGNGLLETRGYDNVTGRLRSIADAPVAGPAVFSVEYDYASDGMLEWRRDNVVPRAETFEHDALHRLKGWHLVTPGAPTYDGGYEYDPLSVMDHNRRAWDADEPVRDLRARLAGDENLRRMVAQDWEWWGRRSHLGAAGTGGAAGAHPPPTLEFAAEELCQMDEVNSAVMGTVGSLSVVGGERVFRAMTQAHADQLFATDRLLATRETFLSPTESYARQYTGVVVEFALEPGTLARLEGIGVRDGSARVLSQYPLMPLVKPGWVWQNAYFKKEGLQINIGLGKGQALQIFNDGIRGYSVIYP
jgi:YD repeat-containing protein